MTLTLATNRHYSRAAIASVLVYALVWITAYVFYARTPGTHPMVAIASLAVFGGALSLVALLLTRNVSSQSIDVPRPAASALTSVAYVFLFAIVVLGIVFTGVDHSHLSERLRTISLLAIKVITMVVIPLAIIRSQRWAVPHVLSRRRTFTVTAVLIAATLGTVLAVTPSISEIAGLHLAPLPLATVTAGCFLFVVVNAALPEEVLFRLYLQSTLAAFLRSETPAAIAATLIFAAAHVPGLYLRGDQAAQLGTQAPSIWLCFAYAISVLSPIGILFSILWIRTRSIMALLLVHASVDVLPNVADFVHLWAPGALLKSTIF